MIEVFKTNVKKKKDATAVLSRLRTILPSSAIHIDLEDCDKVLRVETYKDTLDPEMIIREFKRYNLSCQVLDY